MKLNQIGTSFPPTRYRKPYSAPAITSLRHIFFEQSLHIFSIPTDQSTKEDNCHNKKKDKHSDKEKENIRYPIQKEDIKKVNMEEI